MLTLAAARAGASLTPSPTMPVGAMAGVELGDRRDLVGRQEVGSLFTDAQLAGHGGGRPCVVAGEHDGLKPELVQLGQHAGRLGPRPIGQPDPAQRAGARRQGHGRSGRLFGLTELGVELGAAQPGFVDVAMAPQVIFDRVDLPQCSQPRDGRVIVGDGDVESQAAGVPGDGLAQHVPTPVAERRRDPQNMRFVFLTGRANDLDDIRLPAGQGAGLVESQRPQPADLFEVLAPADQHPAPRRGRQPTDDGHRRRDHQRTRTGDDQDDQAPPKPLAPDARVHRAGPARGQRPQGWNKHDQERQGDDDRRVNGGEPRDPPLDRRTAGLARPDLGDDPRDQARHPPAPRPLTSSVPSPLIVPA